MDKTEAQGKAINSWGKYFRHGGNRWTQAEESSLGKKYIAIHRHATRSGLAKGRGQMVGGADVLRHEVPKSVKIYPRGTWEKQYK
jgi:hypothetical protein